MNLSTELYHVIKKLDVYMHVVCGKTKMNYKQPHLLNYWLLLSLFSYGESTEYFVSITDGYDNNPRGTIDKPWQHVGRAVLSMHPGDICTIRGGDYYEEILIKGLKGTQDKPVIFRAYPGEEVVFKGTGGPIPGPWHRYTDHIFRTKLDYDIWQLFVNGKMQVNARWPNANWSDFSVFDYTNWGFSSVNSTYNETTGTGVMIDNGTHNLAESGLNAMGAVAVLNIGSWLTYAGRVEEHKTGENRFKYNLSMVPNSVHFVPRNSRYFLEDKLEFLDSPGEWFYDYETSFLYLWTETSQYPEYYDIEGKTKTYAFTITNGSSWIILSNLNFFATTVYISGTNANDDVSNIKLESLHFSYPSYSKRMLRSLAVPNTTTLYYYGSLTENAGNFSVFNCTWEYADGQTITYRGADGLFQNNLWHHNDFSCVGDGELFYSKGVRDTFIRNVIHSNGPSVGYQPGGGNQKDKELGLPTASTVKLNIFHDLKYLQNDGAHVQTSIASQNGVLVENNWCFNTKKWGLRFDRIMSPNATWGYNGTMSHNVVWNTSGLSVKGDKHHLYNNLAFDSLYPWFDLMLLGDPGDGMKGENEHTETVGNVLQKGTCNYHNKPGCNYTPGNYTNNVVGDVRNLLRDPDNLDFRPKPNSDLISKGIGPYSLESMKDGGTYWIPGRQELRASMPIPPNGTTTARCDASLMWLAGYDAESHDLYLSNDKEAVAKANSTSDHKSLLLYAGKLSMPTNIVNTESSFKADRLYYWRVDARVVSTEEVVVGQVWTFTCKA